MEDNRIIFNIDVMLAKRKMSVTELSEKVGITMANISILKNGKAKALKVSTLAKLCDALDCQPGDILEFRKDELYEKEKQNKFNFTKGDKNDYKSAPYYYRNRACNYLYVPVQAKNTQRRQRLRAYMLRGNYSFGNIL